MTEGARHERDGGRGLADGKWCWRWVKLMAAVGALARAATYRFKSTVTRGVSGVSASRSAASVSPRRLKDGFVDACRLVTTISLLISISDWNVWKNLDRCGSPC